ncbi:hypothetical protein AB5J62_07410 [Amycolatopsis sp. cg5]|uniref:hypothetical protein n=1 Tax=Amycolatopsis sp. cg5 TaxID=3238802 RepID=UPI003523D759
MTATPSLRELAAVRTHYWELLGSPVTIEVRTRRLLIATGDALDAITMPPEFGEQVLAGLRIAMLAGPVIAGDANWTFLTRPVVTHSVPEDLARLRVHAIPHGEQLVLPASEHQWVLAPSPRQQPTLWTAVIGTARRAAHHLAAVELSEAA